jgi:hypothetical protein
VTTEVFTSNVLVNTASVSFEIFVDGEGDGKGSLLHELLLHAVDTLNGIRALGLELVALVVTLVTRIRALAGALGGGVGRKVLAGRKVLGGVGVVSTRVQRVRLARRSVVNILEVTTSSDASLGEPVPGTRGLTTIAAHRE